MSREMYCITPEGELKPTSEKDKNSCAIIVDSDAKKIYLSISEEAPVREKFIAARMAAELKRSYGLVYKIENI